MPSNTILLLYVSVGQGHRRAALAIESALKEADPFLRIVCLDLMELWPRWVGRLIVGLYRGLVRAAPRLWAYLYDHRRIKERFARPLDIIHLFCRRRVCGLMKELSPAAVVCTQAIPCTLVADCKAHSPTGYSLIAVPTDFLVHTYWINDNIDLYLLPSRESGLLVIERGVDAGRVRVTGIPVHPEFARRLDPEVLKRKYGLVSSLPTVLMMGGGEGSVSMARLISALDVRKELFQMAALSGRNLKQHAQLMRLRDRLVHPLTVFSFTDSVDELMAAVDLIVTKPGGLTTAEALVKKLPMVLIDPLPGQEDFNARFLQEHGAANSAADDVDAAEAVSDLLVNGDLRSRMVAAGEKIRRPDAARLAARYIIDSIN